MIWYMVLIIGVTGISFFGEKIKLKVNNKLINWGIIVAVLILTLFAGLRNEELGTDYKEYAKIFTSINTTLGWSANIEIGFVALNLLVGKIFNDPVFLFIICAFIICLLIGMACAEESVMPWMSLFLFVAFGLYTNTFNIMRQWIAVSIIVFGYKYIYKKETLKFVIAVILATLFHKSAIILLPIYFFCVYNKSDVLRVIIIIITIIATLYIKEIFAYLYELLKNTGFRYVKYLDPNNISLGNSRGLTFPLFSILCYLFHILLKTMKIETDSKSNRQVNLLILAFVFSCIGQRYELVLRLQFYFVPVLMFIIPYYLKVINKLPVTLLVVVMGIIYYIYILSNSSLVPYQIIGA